MSLLFAGVDEAGYGPMLGPLCVACAALSIEDWDPASEKAPNVWALLRPAVCKTRKAARKRIAVADSKDLKLANSSVGQHPLCHLERAVLAFLSARDGDFPRTDLELFAALNAEFEDCPWYGGEPIELPLGCDETVLKLDANQLRRTMNRRGVGLIEIRVRVICEGRFNELYQIRRSKAVATEHALVGHLSVVDGLREGFEHTRIVCDRQGGRTRYHGMLGEVFEGIEVHEESARACRYGIGEELGVTLTPGADGAYFPVALASMAAKLVRELAMARFNRYWGTMIPEIRPTAGYTKDAHRWLADASEHITPAQRRAMVRLA